MTDVTTAMRDEGTGQQVNGRPDLLIHVPAPGGESLQTLREYIAASVSACNPPANAVITFASPDGYRLDEMGTSAGNLPDVESAQQSPAPGVAVVPYSLAARSSTPSVLPWIQDTMSYMGALRMAQACDAKVCLMLGPELQSMQTDAIPRLVASIMQGAADLQVPAYTLGAYEGLLNSAILYPLTRALYGRQVRYPLGFDLAMSARMQARMMACITQHRADSQEEWLPWPVSEAVAASLTVDETMIGARQLPPTESLDLSTIMSVVVGSLFADAETKAVYWQRVRVPQPASAQASHVGHETQPPDVRGMVESFQLAERNLEEVWSLVLPPNSVLALRKLARLPASEFQLPDTLWVRIVYDFLLAYRLRAINRTHLLGALTPLYLGWVASHVIETSQRQADVETRVEALARAFESDKAYLVARWRWPDRFNP